MLDAITDPWLFIVAGLLLNLTPGADIAYTVSRAAAQGVKEAQAKVDRAAAAARELYERSMQAYGAGRHADALPLLREADEKGGKEAQFTLSNMYRKGRGGLAQDSAKALAWLRKAAAQGYPQGFKEAQFVLGYMHYHGKGGLAEIPPNALQWFRKAAAQGHHAARLYLARMHRRGERGLVMDPEEALRLRGLVRAAADAGDAKAREALEKFAARFEKKAAGEEQPLKKKS